MTARLAANSGDSNSEAGLIWRPGFDSVGAFPRMLQLTSAAGRDAVKENSEWSVAPRRARGSVPSLAATDGCVAVTDQEIEEIVRVVPVGTVIRIEP